VGPGGTGGLGLWSRSMPPSVGHEAPGAP
jgi:hypothetical protein